MPDALYTLDQVAIRLVKEPPILSEKPINNAEAAIELARDIFRDYDREVLSIVNLKADLTPINLNIISMGAVDSTVANPREILKSPILSNATSAILIHNHPSGHLEPSSHDIELTAQLQSLFVLLNIKILDHVIIGDHDHYYSFREKGQMPIGQLHYSAEMHEINLKEAFPIEKESALKRLEEAKDKVKRKEPQIRNKAHMRGGEER